MKRGKKKMVNEKLECHIARPHVLWVKKVALSWIDEHYRKKKKPHLL